LPCFGSIDTLRRGTGSFTQLAREGESVLGRKSIRTKLVVGLGLLSGIVLLLAFSGFWGLHRYRQLAQGITNRAEELDLAHQLHQSASALKSHDERLDQYRQSSWLQSKKGLIESNPIQDPLIGVSKSVEGDYAFEMGNFQDKLERYLDLANAMANQSDEPFLIDRASQLENIRKIANAFDQLKAQRRTIDDSLSTHRFLGINRHNILFNETLEHLDAIREEMAQFSDEVQGQCSLWMSVTWICTILAFVMMGLLITAFHSLVVKPFSTLVDGSRLVAGGQFNHRIDLGTGDELSELAEAMNAMTDRFQGAFAKVEAWCTDLDRQVQERTREVIQNEQLASVGFLAAGVAHEINNPLASIAWSAESLQSRAAELTMLDTENRILDDELCEALVTNLRRIEEEAYRCKGITEKLLDFSRLSEVRRAPTDLSELVRDVVLMVGKVGKYRCKTIRVNASQSVVASINPQEIRQVVLNLVTNALESVDCDGAVEVDVNADDQRAIVAVQDNGCGMSHEVLKHLFEPFFTRRRDGTGTGLGLSITYRIVSQHGGSLIAQSEGEGRGSRLEMLLPLFTENVDSSEPISSGWNHEPYQTA
jgi:signal transduction histidine kinase